ncbi:MAG TPA: transporter substrate-binding domain-containing protein [Gammaproteobacteria bacterium]|nr:transporter substrate-binding domain-containing protein [Gammaproteobacteria bacterium]
MKISTRITSLAFLLFTLPVLAAPNNLQLAADAWPPYVDPSLPEQGLAMDLVKTALQRAGYTNTVHISSWDRVLEGAQIGVYDVIVAAWHSKQRESFLYFSEPYFKNKILLLKNRATSIRYKKLDDLNKYVIGVIANYAYDHDFDNSRVLNKIPDTQLIRNLIKLRQLQIDLTLDDELVLLYAMNKYMPKGAKELEFLQPPLALRSLRIGISKKNPDHRKIAARFDKAIQDMIKDGSYQKILEKHLSYIKLPTK